jgi:hypothetical protein
MECQLLMSVASAAVAVKTVYVHVGAAAVDALEISPAVAFVHLLAIFQMVQPWHGIPASQKGIETS